MSVEVNKYSVLWVDSKEAMSPLQNLAFSQKGLHIKCICIADLSAAALSGVDVAVVSVTDDLDHLSHLMGFINNLGVQLPIIARVPVNQFELGIDAMRQGASTVVPQHELEASVWAAAIDGLNIPQPEPTKSRGFVFVDPLSRKLLALTERVAQAEVSVLLAGPTGAGKEVLARILHDSSPRHAGPFIAFNCAAMPENLVEDMLFGHERGSFTGAAKTQLGLFEQAQGGTIFLDEIGEMSFHLQAKLLRVLQERRITRLGGVHGQEIQLDIKVVAATNLDLKQAIAKREFREDLYFRLSAFKITLPSLSARPMDIIPLAEQFVSEHLSDNQVVRISQEAANCLVSHSWPGNVRELQNVMIRANILSQNGLIDEQHLVFDELTVYQENPEDTSIYATSTSRAEDSHVGIKKIESLSQSIRNSEHKRIMDVLQESKNREQAAKTLGISPRTLRHKLQRFREDGIEVMRAYAR